mgnify:CR=1 FL=1
MKQILWKLEFSQDKFNTCNSYLKKACISEVGESFFLMVKFLMAYTSYFVLYELSFREKINIVEHMHL